MFGSPTVALKGSIEVYEQIQKARKALGVKAESIPLSVIGLLDMNQQLTRLFKGGLQTGPGVSRIRFSKNVIRRALRRRRLDLPEYRVGISRDDTDSNDSRNPEMMDERNRGEEENYRNAQNPDGAFRRQRRLQDE